jgi:hypothetical protein
MGEVVVVKVEVGEGGRRGVTLRRSWSRRAAAYLTWRSSTTTAILTHGRIVRGGVGETGKEWKGEGAGWEEGGCWIRRSI